MTISEHLSALFAASQQRHAAITSELEDASGHHVKVKVTAKGQPLIIYWLSSGRKPRDKACEELGEDAGFYDPVFRNWSCSVSANAVLIAEGFRGALCTHHFGNITHLDGKKEAGVMQTCQNCGLLASRMVARRGQRESCQYDNWELRPHIFSAWLQRGPVPGALLPKAHHHHTPEQHAQELRNQGFIRHIRWN